MKGTESEAPVRETRTSEKITQLRSHSEPGGGSQEPAPDRETRNKVNLPTTGPRDHEVQNYWVETGSKTREEEEEREGEGERTREQGGGGPRRPGIGDPPAAGQ